MEVNARDSSVLKHIIAYCIDIEETAERFGRSWDVFREDKAYRNACALCIMQIGELCGHLSEEFRQSYPEIPWNAIRGMRNVVAHAYGASACGRPGKRSNMTFRR